MAVKIKFFIDNKYWLYLNKKIGAVYKYTPLNIG